MPTAVSGICVWTVSWSGVSPAHKMRRAELVHKRNTCIHTWMSFICLKLNTWLAVTVQIHVHNHTHGDIAGLVGYVWCAQVRHMVCQVTSSACAQTLRCFFNRTRYFVDHKLRRWDVEGLILYWNAYSSQYARVQFNEGHKYERHSSDYNIQLRWQRIVTATGSARTSWYT